MRGIGTRSNESPTLADSFYITTPIYYVNGSPHIGHAYTTIAADTITRYQRLKGREARFLTGTDEHGQKVLEAAEARGMTPRAHCDDLVVVWKAMMSRLNIEYDRFIRTTDSDHEALVKAVLTKLWERGEIYKDEYVGWYLVKDEVFVTGKDHEARIASGELKEEDFRKIKEANYFFKMGSYKQQLVDHIEANDDFIQPENRRNEVLGFLRKDLGDLCISRPKSRMSWGIELPFDSEFVTYVWFDALLNYLTGTGYHPDPDVADPSWNQWWPADFNLIGKDILTTHSVYWTTMLLAMGVPLPKHIYAHGWWVSSDGDKIGKSAGNAIDIDLLVDAFGVDATRFFFLREIRFGADGGFSYEQFLSRYNTDLANDLGNLAHRGLSMTTNWLGGQVPPLGEITDAERDLRELATAALRTFDTEMDALHYSRALSALLDVVGAGNKYIDTQQPWALNKAGNTKRLQTVKRHVLEICYFAATLLLPFMPEKSAILLEKLGRSPHAAERSLQSMLAAGRANLDQLPEGLPVNVGDQLFPRFREMPDAIQALFAEAPAPKPKKAKKPKKPKKGAPVEEIEFGDFMKVQLKVGVIQKAEQHPNADRLLVLSVDLGEPQPRTIVAGIKSKFSAEEVVGRKVVVVANLKPAKLRGVESQGMILAAGEKEVLDLVGVDAPVGEIVR